MKKLKLIDIAPYSGKRVQPFDGVKQYMSTGDLKGDNLSFEEVTYESKPSRADITVSEGDILFAKMTNTNKALQIDKDLDGMIVSTGFSVHKPIENVLDGSYFLHYLKHDYFQRQKNKFCTGAIQLAISNAGIEKIFIPLPEYPDQAKIADILNKSETLIKQRAESIALLDEFSRSTYLEMFGDPIKNTLSWPIERLDNLAKLERGRFSPRPRNDPSYYNGKYPFIQTGDISKSGNRLISYTQTLNENGIKVSKEFKKRTIVIAIVGATIGATAILKIDVYATDSIIGITADKTRTNEIFLEFTLRFWKPVLLRIAPEAARANINLEILNKLKFPVPPIDLQNQFAQIVDKTEALKTQYQKSLREFENLYGSLSQKAFKG
jgi:type I restriction enzyme S subunit